MLTRLLAVAAETPSPSPAPTRYIDPQTVTPGVVGFVIFVALAVATFFLWRSMNKQIMRIDFDESPDEDADGASHGAADRAEALPPADDVAGSGVAEVPDEEASRPDKRSVDLRDNG